MKSISKQGFDRLAQANIDQEYANMSEDEWTESLFAHIQNLDRVANQAINQAVQNYLKEVFGSVTGPNEKSFVEDLIAEYRSQFENSNISLDRDFYWD
jgi:hypothetical protein